MAANIATLRARSPESPTLRRYGEVAGWLTGRDRADAEDGVRAIQVLCGMLRISKLAAFGITVDGIPDIVRQAQQASSMKANPLVLTASELAEVLVKAL